MSRAFRVLRRGLLAVLVVAATATTGLVTLGLAGATPASADEGITQVIPPAYSFDAPGAMSYDGTDVWVANNDGPSIAEIDPSTDAVVRVISGPSHGFAHVSQISSDGTHVWVTDGQDDLVAELDAATGALVQVISGPSYGFDWPYAISSDGTHVWVGNIERDGGISGGNTVTELDAATGALVQVLSDPSYGFDYPHAITSDGTHVWVASTYSYSVAEIDAATGALVQQIDLPQTPGLSGPYAISDDGANVWVVNVYGDSLTEINAATGSVVRVVSGSSYGFNDLLGVSSDGSDVWVSDFEGNSVTEVDATTGALVQVLGGASYGFQGPEGIASDGTHVWVGNGNGNSVTELDAATGGLAQAQTGNAVGFADPDAISSDGAHVWVASRGNAVTELDAATGGLVQVLSDASYGFDEPEAISSDGADVWVANASGNSVTEIDTATGGLVQVLSGAGYGFNEPEAISSDGTHVWVGNNNGNSVTELDAGTGAFVQVIGGFTHPNAVSSDGTHVWVANSYSVTELDAGSGSIVEVISSVDDPDGISADGTHVWVANLGDNAVTEIDAATGSIVQTIGGFGLPLAISSDGTAVWVANGESVSVLDASDGALVSVISGLGYGSSAADAISSDGTHVWAASYDNTVTELSAGFDPQTISFTSTPPSTTYPGGPDYTVSATGGASGNPVTFSSSDPAVCEFSGSTVTFVGAGTCTITATEAGNSTYTGATATQTIEVDLLPQSVTFTSSPPPLTFPGGPDYTVSASGGASGNPVTFSSAQPSVCAVSGSTVSFVGGGTCTITANQAGTTTYAGAMATQSFAVDPCAIPAFTSPASVTASAGSAFTFTATTCHPLVPDPSFAARNLPPGLTITGNGDNSATISGTPSPLDHGTYLATLSATVPGEPAGKQTLRISVDHAPVFPSRAARTVHTGMAFKYVVSTKFGLPAPSITTASTLPSGISLVDNGNGTALLEGAPGAGTGGVYPITITASNGIGSPATQTLVLTVDQAPAITSAPGDTITAGTAMAPFAVTVTGFPKATLRAVGLPYGLKLSGNTITGTPGAAGTYNVLLVAVSMAGRTTQPFTLVVSP